jgi:hypothetical protein
MQRHQFFELLVRFSRHRFQDEEGTATTASMLQELIEGEIKPVITLDMVMANQEYISKNITDNSTDDIIFTNRQTLIRLYNKKV